MQYYGAKPLEMITKGIISLLKTVVRLQRRRDLIPGQVRSVLLVESTRLGDVIALLPVIPRFRLQFPQAKFTLAVSERFAPLVASLAIDVEVLPLDESNSVRKTTHNIKMVRERQYDLACSMSPSRRNALLVLSAQSQFRVGYLESRNSVTPFLESTPVTGLGCVIEEQEPFSGRSIYERPHLVANAVQAPDSTAGIACSMRPAAIAEAMERLRSIGLPPESPFVMIHPFALWRYRAWDPRLAARLCRLISDDGGMKAVVVGSPEDFSDADSGIAGLFKDAGALLFISNDLRETAALMTAARLFVGSDSGPLHLAAALGTPIVGLFGPAAPRLTAPPHAQGEVLYHQLACSPCTQRTCILPTNSCMSRHLPEDVSATISRIAGVTRRVVANG
jgi:ADP-heptose:LPS heptosyltransferase